MAIQSSRFHDGRRGSALTVWVIPQSDADELEDILEDGTLTIRLKAPRASGANLDLIYFLAKMLEISASQVEIIAGGDGAEKLVAVLDIDPDEVQRRIMKAWSGE